MSRTPSNTPLRNSEAVTQASPETHQYTISRISRRTYHPSLYTPHTPFAIIDFFEIIFAELSATGNEGRTPLRYRIHYGDIYTGRAWSVDGERDDIDIGYIALSSGSTPAFITLFNSRSTGGAAISLANIVRIECVGDDWAVYRHPHYHRSDDEAPAIVANRTQPERQLRRINIGRRASGEGET